jgi:hypothetical protein
MLDARANLLSTYKRARSKVILQGFSKYAFVPRYRLPSAFFLILKAVKKAKGNSIPLPSKYLVALKREI